MEILEYIFKEAGVSPEQYNAIVSNEALKAIAVPEEVSKAVKSNIVSLNKAKEIPDIANHFKGTHFGLIDAATKEALKSVGVDEEVVNAIFKKGNTAERVADALKTANELGRKKAGANSNEQLEELRKIVADAKAEKESLIASYTAQIAERESAYNGLLYSNALSSAIKDTGLKLVNLPQRQLSQVAESLVNEKLAELKARAVVENGRIKLVSLADASQEHYTGAEKTDFYKLLPSILETIADKTNGTHTGGNIVLNKPNTPKTAHESVAEQMLTSFKK